MTTTAQQRAASWQSIEAVYETARLAREGASVAEAETRSIVHELAGLAAERQAQQDLAEREGRKLELSAFELREQFLRDRRRVLLEIAAAHKRQIRERELQAHVLLVDGWLELAAELDAQAMDLLATRDRIDGEIGASQQLQELAEAAVCRRWSRLLNVFPPPNNLAPEPGGDLLPAVRPDLGGSWLASFEVEEWWPRWLVTRHAEAVELRRHEQGLPGLR